MAFAGNQNDILRRGLGHGIFDGGAAVGVHKCGLRHGGQNIVDNRLRRFQARVVAGDHHFIGGGGGRTHQRALAFVAVAAAAEHTPQARALRLDFVERGNRFFERIGRVRVIHHHQGRIGAHDAVHAAGGRADLRQRGQHFIERIAVGAQQAHAGGEVLRIEAAEQTAAHFAAAPRRIQHHAHAV